VGARTTFHTGLACLGIIGGLRPTQLFVWGLHSPAFGSAGNRFCLLLAELGSVLTSPPLHNRLHSESRSRDPCEALECLSGFLHGLFILDQKTFVGILHTHMK
jgi:hypothetical protein